jgi:mycofactocin precursor peptide peptidase
MTTATWTELASRTGRYLLVVPLGSYEQHGPHLPLDTDTQIAEALAGRAAELPYAVVAPALAYGASGEHAGFPGTLSVGTKALETLLVELVRSARQGAAGVAFVSAHGGNAEALARARTLCEREGDHVIAWAPNGVDGDAHAGRTETSLMLAIAPQSVRRGAIEPGRTDPVGELWPELRRRGVRAVSPNGVLGDPTSASAEEGHRILDDLGRSLVAALESWWTTLTVASPEKVAP